MKAKDVFDGMTAILTESLLDEEGFREGDVVTVETNTNRNIFGWKRIQLEYGEDSEFIVNVYSKTGKSTACYTRRLTPAVNFQLELF